MKAVHPRIRGERRYRIIRGSRWTRFIPAYAGNAYRRRYPTKIHAVHPRIRGERKRPTELLRTVLGSSPHTRGTPHTSSENSLNRRFIPAYAGNAGEGKINATLMAVHPRIRGERNGFTV